MGNVFGEVVSAYRSTLHAVKKRKGLFTLFCLFQLLFLIILSSVFIHYQLVLFDDLVAIGAPLETLNFDEESLQAGAPLVDNPIALLASYRSLINNIISLLTWLSVLVLIINPLLWICASFMQSSGFSKSISFGRKIIIFSKMWLKNVTALLAIFLPFGILYYVVVLRWIGSLNPFFLLITRIFVALFFILFYVFLVASSRIEIASWKKYIFSIKRIVTTHFFSSLLVVLFSLALPVLLASCLYYATLIQENFTLMVISAILFVISLFFGKMVLVGYSKGK